MAEPTRSSLTGPARSVLRSYTHCVGQGQSAPRQKGDRSLKDFERVLLDLGPEDLTSLVRESQLWRTVRDSLEQCELHWDVLALLLNRLSMEEAGRKEAMERGFTTLLGTAVATKGRTTRGDKGVERICSMAVLLAMLCSDATEEQVAPWLPALCMGVKESLERSESMDNSPVMEAYTMLSLFIKLLYTATGTPLAGFTCNSFLACGTDGVPLLFRVARRGLIQEVLTGAPKIVAEKSLVILAKLNADVPEPLAVIQQLDPVELATFLVKCARNCSWVQSQDIALALLARVAFKQQQLPSDFLDKPEVIDMLRHILTLKSTGLKVTGVAFISLAPPSFFSALAAEFETAINQLAQCGARSLKTAMWESTRGVWGMDCPLSGPAAQALQQSQFLAHAAAHVPAVLPKCLWQLLPEETQRMVAASQGVDSGLGPLREDPGPGSAAGTPRAAGGDHAAENGIAAAVGPAAGAAAAAAGAAAAATSSAAGAQDAGAAQLPSSASRAQAGGASTAQQAATAEVPAACAAAAPTAPASVLTPLAAPAPATVRASVPAGSRSSSEVPAGAASGSSLRTASQQQQPPQPVAGAQQVQAPPAASPAMGVLMRPGTVKVGGTATQPPAAQPPNQAGVGRAASGGLQHPGSKGPSIPMGRGALLIPGMGAPSAPAAGRGSAAPGGRGGAARGQEQGAGRGRGSTPGPLAKAAAPAAGAPDLASRSWPFSLAQQALASQTAARPEARLRAAPAAGPPPAAGPGTAPGIAGPGPGAGRGTGASTAPVMGASAPKPAVAAPPKPLAPGSMAGPGAVTIAGGNLTFNLPAGNAAANFAAATRVIAAAAAARAAAANAGPGASAAAVAAALRAATAAAGASSSAPRAPSPASAAMPSPAPPAPTSAPARAPLPTSTPAPAPIPVSAATSPAAASAPASTAAALKVEGQLPGHTAASASADATAPPPLQRMVGAEAGSSAVGSAVASAGKAAAGGGGVAAEVGARISEGAMEMGGAEVAGPEPCVEVSKLEPEVRRLLTEEGMITNTAAISRPKPSIRINKSVVDTVQAVLALQQLQEGSAEEPQLADAEHSQQQQQQQQQQQPAASGKRRMSSHQVSGGGYSGASGLDRAGGSHNPEDEGVSTAMLPSKRQRRTSSYAQLAGHQQPRASGPPRSTPQRSHDDYRAVHQGAAAAAQHDMPVPSTSDEQQPPFEFGAEDVQSLNRMLDDLYAQRQSLGHRGQTLVKNLAEGAANMSMIVYLRTYHLPASASIGLDDRLATLKARAHLVYEGVTSNEPMDVLLPFSELFSAEAGIVRRNLEAVARVSGVSVS